jgi:hypothetical protein
MERYALLFTVKPGSEEKAAEILRTYGRPSSQASENTQLVSTTVFIKGNIIVRLLEINGKLEEAAAHLSQQEAVRKVEQALSPLLEYPHDLSNPQAAKDFFQQALMTRLTHREAGRPIS